MGVEIRKVERCSACGQSHELKFRELAHNESDPDGWTDYAYCEAGGEIVFARKDDAERAWTEYGTVFAPGWWSVLASEESYRYFVDEVVYECVAERLREYGAEYRICAADDGWRWTVLGDDAKERGVVRWRVDWAGPEKGLLRVRLEVRTDYLASLCESHAGRMAEEAQNWVDRFLLELRSDYETELDGIESRSRGQALAEAAIRDLGSVLESEPKPITAAQRDALAEAARVLLEKTRQIPDSEMDAAERSVVERLRLVAQDVVEHAATAVVEEEDEETCCGCVGYCCACEGDCSHWDSPNPSEDEPQYSKSLLEETHAGRTLFLEGEADGSFADYVPGQEWGIRIEWKDGDALELRQSIERELARRVEEAKKIREVQERIQLEFLKAWEADQKSTRPNPSGPLSAWDPQALEFLKAGQADQKSTRREPEGILSSEDLRYRGTEPVAGVPGAFSVSYEVDPASLREAKERAVAEGRMPPFERRDMEVVEAEEDGVLWGVWGDDGAGGDVLVGLADSKKTAQVLLRVRPKLAEEWDVSQRWIQRLQVETLPDLAWEMAEKVLEE